jgi:hypothetical protein
MMEEKSRDMSGRFASGVVTSEVLLDLVRVNLLTGVEGPGVDDGLCAPWPESDEADPLEEDFFLVNFLSEPVGVAPDLATLPAGLAARSLRMDDKDIFGVATIVERAARRD